MNDDKQKGHHGIRDDIYNGFIMQTFDVDGCKCHLVEPHKAKAGRPWVWKAEFFEAFPKFELAMLEKGFYLAYITVGNTFGSPSALKHWYPFYREMTERRGLSRHPVLLGLSRGGLYVYNWAAANPDKVSCIIGDNPVCDFKSWPAGKGKGPGSPQDWQDLLKCYGFKTEAEALSYKKNPVDNLKPLADAGIPLLHVCGDADEVVPFEENTVILKENYEKLGGHIEIIIKPEGKHHPHGLEDPAQMVEFVLRNQKT